ncbi:hypothetical protein ACLB2K_075954 [Fragaria x ananassa]
MADIGLDQSTQSPNASFMPTTPLQLSGFLTGDTIQVTGDTGSLKFLVQFNIQEKHTPYHNNNLFNSLGADASHPENEHQTCQNSNVSSYVTPPNGVQEVEDQNSYQFPEEGGGSTGQIVTRLSSGVISPVNYFPQISLSSSGLRLCGKKRYEGKNQSADDVFERVLRRHRSPIRPCTSYAFFVMATWGSVKSSSFGETSKQLGQMWCQLPQTKKRFYKEMAMKDSARYKKQCVQLMKKPTQSTARRLKK